MEDTTIDALLRAARSWPMDKRLAHSNWKVRSEAFEFVSEHTRGLQEESRTIDSVDTAKLLLERLEHVVDRNVLGYQLAKAVGDPNANVMDKALDAYYDYLNILGTLLFWPEMDERMRASSKGILEKQAELCLTHVTSKCLKASKKSTVQKSVQVCMMLIEVEQGSVVMDRIVEDGFTHKVPKAVVAALEVVLEAVRSFTVSCAAFDEVEYSKTVLNGMVKTKVYSHANAAVRNAVKDIVSVLMKKSKRTDAAVRGILLDQLPEAMKKEVMDMAGSHDDDGSEIIKRYTKRQQAEMVSSNDDVEMMDVEGGCEAHEPALDNGDYKDDEDVDPYDFAQPKNVMVILQKTTFTVGDDEDDALFWDCFGSKKWNVRKNALEKVRQVVDEAVRLEPQNGDYSSLVREIRRVLSKDANIHCAAAAAAASESMAKALRGDFSSYAKQLCPEVMNRFKEKNPVMCQAADSCLQTFGTYCYSLKDISDDIATALSHKNPKVRADTLRYLAYLVNRESKQSVSQCKDSLSAVIKLVSDADVKIRDEAQNVVTAFAVKLGGFPAIKPYLNGLDDKKKGVLEKAFDDARISGKVINVSSSINSNRNGIKQPSNMNSAPSLVSKKPMVSKPRPSKPMEQAKRAPSKTERSAPRKGTSSTPEMYAIENEMTIESAEAFLTGAFGTALVENLRSALWQERLGSMNEIVEKASEFYSTNNDASSLLLSLAKIPGWEDKNFQVVNKLFEISAKATEESKRNDFGFAHASCIIHGAVEKIHEIKHRAQATAALNGACDRVGPKYVVSVVHQKAAQHKNPKVLSECLFWMTKTIEQYGYELIDNSGSIVAWMTNDLGSSNPAVRSQALALLGECHSQVGPAPFKLLMDTLKPALVTSLQEVYDKRPLDSSYRPSKSVSPSVNEMPMASMTCSPDEDANISTGEISNDHGLMDDASIDRIDVSSRFNDSLIAQLMSSNWKERNAAVDSVSEILSAAKNITPDIPSDLLTSMKARFADTNRNLAAKSISVVGMLATAIGEPFDRLAHGILLAPAVSNLADTKKQVRDAVIGMLEAWGKTCPKDRLFPALAEAVSNPKGSAEGKVYALEWMVDNYVANVKCKDIATKAYTLASRDKAAAVRNMGAKLEAICKSTALTAATSKTPSRKPATKAPIVSRTPARSVAKEKSAKSRLGQTPTAKVVAKQRPGSGVIGAEEGPLIRMGHGKAVRNKQYRPRQGGFEPLDATERSNLKEFFVPIVSPSLCSKMFSMNFKDHVEAADILIDAVPHHLGEMTTSLDLFLQWSVLILCEANTQSSMRTLDLLRTIIENLGDDGYRLNDMEASILLPAVIERSGQNQDYLRSGYRSIIMLSTSVYNPSKVIDYVTQGLASKNARTKVECCTVLSQIVLQHNGRYVLNARQKPVSAISMFVKERDPALRAAAMKALQSIYDAVGDSDFSILMESVKEDDRDIIESKLLTMPPESHQAPVPMDLTMTPAAVHDTQEYQTMHQTTNDIPSYKPHNLEMTPDSHGADSFGEEIESMKTPVSNTLQLPARKIEIDTPVPSELKTTPGVTVIDTDSYTTPAYDEDEFEQRWNRNIELMYTNDLATSVEATKQICSDIMTITSKDVAPPSRRVLAVLGSSGDKFFLAVCAQLELIFADASQQVQMDGNPPSSRGCKFALNALLQGLGIKEISQNIPQATLRATISLLLCSLVDEHGLLCFDQGTTLVRAVNVLIAKMLDSADKNYSFAALLHLLRSPPRNLSPDLVPKFNDLVVKCLIKLTKGMDSQTTDIDISFLLLCLHDYFMFLGVEEIRKRSAAEDKPLRMVKTILHQICKLTGYNVYQYTSGIPGRHSQPQPIIFRYIDINLKMLKEMNQLPKEPMLLGAPPTKTSDASLYTEVAKPETSVEEEAKPRLKDILSRVMSKDDTIKKVAMRELLDIKRSHPQMLDKYLRGTQERFRNYIEESLQVLESGSSGGVQSNYAPPIKAPFSYNASDRRMMTRDNMADIQTTESTHNQVSSVDMLAERMARLKQHKLELSK